MDTSNKGWNRDILGQRNASQGGSEPKDLTDAEFYLTVGRIVRNRVDRGLDVKSYANRVNMSERRCRMAMSYANASPGLILRALVEDWKWSRIQKELKTSPSKQGG